MPLTACLYREDEVVAALKWCLMRGRTLEAMFWAQECSDSNMVQEALDAAFWVWLFGCGPSNLGWLNRFATCIKHRHYLNDAELMGLISSLSIHMRQRPDSSALVLLGLGLRTEFMGPSIPDQLGPQRLPLSLSEFESDTVYGPSVRALVQGKTPLAWAILRPTWYQNNWSTLSAFVKEHPCLSDSISLLESAPSWMGFLWKDEYTWPVRAVAVASLSSLKPPIMEREPCDDYMKQWAEWLKAPMRFRRPYTIPTDCLYWFTARGNLRVSETTEGELTDGLEKALIGSKIWKMHEKELDDDESRQNFYDTYFPNDIPDEWSAASRAVSHGRGVVPVGDIQFHIVFERCLDRWFQRVPNCIWKGTENALAEFKRRWAYSPPQSLERGIHEAYTHEKWNFVSTWSFVQMRREITVLNSTK